MIAIARYYSGYADHMWSFYIRYRDAMPRDAGPDSANWSACHNVWRRLRPEWQTVVALYYQRDRDSGCTVDQYCKQSGMTMATVWKIVRAVQAMAAKERGLITKTEADKATTEGEYSEGSA